MKKAVIGIDGLQEVDLTDSEIAEENKKTKEHNDALPEIEKQGKLELIRVKREPLLLESDHKINTLVDNGGDATAWRTYRQELRDITKAEDLDNVTFPTKPS
tara:strand:- start:87 stop:392 length:306 start_codon:yes stop_codon:yes gene_type:complete